MANAVRTARQKTRTAPLTRFVHLKKCALAFSTLLSSQVTDAHHQGTLVPIRGNHSTLPGQVSRVNSVPRNLANSLTLPHFHYTFCQLRSQLNGERGVLCGISAA